jgi:hypothetical protein
LPLQISDLGLISSTNYCRSAARAAAGLTLWQQIGNTNAHATAMLVRCQPVWHRHKQLENSDFATST